MPNRLALETSPYLIQHAANPVDWYPWGEEALQKAQQEDKPIFLSIGYAACHWCHVMAHESFEDPTTARLMNESFINIKVDREERPDIDSIYMSAVVAMTGQGGWPMSVFLSPNGQPFYAGTYFPPDHRYGMPSFQEVLQAVSRVWNQDRQQALEVGGGIARHLRESTSWQGQVSAPFTLKDLEQAATKLLDHYDWQHGGWGRAPRFPAPMTIEFLLQQGSRGNHAAIKAAIHALKSMQQGGMYDLIGGGFHRYSTDDRWLVPHFEKMLYDNAQLALVYLHAFLLTGETRFQRVCQETLDFILSKLSNPEGGFFSSLDADSEGEEGKSYLWTPAEIQQAINDPADLDLFYQAFELEPDSKLDGKVILRRKPGDGSINFANESETRFRGILDRLAAQRSRRIQPAVDDKVLVAWNGLAIRALAEAARGLQQEEYYQAARKCADFILTNLVLEGRLQRSWRAGIARNNAALEDYAGLILALLALYETDFEIHWLEQARKLAEEMDRAFRDPEGGFFDTNVNQTDLIIRPKDLQDNATPSGNALAGLALLTLTQLEGSSPQQVDTEKLLGSLKQAILEYPTAFSFWLQVADFAVGPVQQAALVWPAHSPRPVEFLNLIQVRYRPRMIVAGCAYPPAEPVPEILMDRPPQNDSPTVYLCHGFVCLRPITDLQDLKSKIGSLEN